MTRDLALNWGRGGGIALFPGNMRKEAGESSLRFYHSVGGPYVFFKSLLHIGDSVTCWVKTPAYWGNDREPWSLPAGGVLPAEAVSG